MARKKIEEEIIIEEPPTISESRGEADYFEHGIKLDAIILQFFGGLVIGAIGLSLIFLSTFVAEDFAIYASMTGYLVGSAIGVYAIGKKYEKESAIGPTLIGTILGLVIYCAAAILTIDSPNAIAEGMKMLFDGKLEVQPIIFITAPLVLAIIAFYTSKFEVYSK